MKRWFSSFWKRCAIHSSFLFTRSQYFFSKKVLGSALHRSLELVLMEASVVEVICDKGG